MNSKYYPTNLIVIGEIDIFPLKYIYEINQIQQLRQKAEKKAGKIEVNTRKIESRKLIGNYIG